MMKVGDLFEFDGFMYPVVDMNAIQGGGLLLRFNGRGPYAMTQKEMAFRPPAHTDQLKSAQRRST